MIVLGMITLVGCTTQAELKKQRATETGMYRKKSIPKTKYIRPALPDLNKEYLTCNYQKKTILVHIENNRGVGTFQACENYEVVHIGYLSTGLPSKYKTPRGDFKVQWKARKYDSKKYPSTDGGNNMNFAMFYDRGFALHTGNIDKHSHGCVRTQKHNAEWLYEWAPHGTNVIIRDL